MRKQGIIQRCTETNDRGVVYITFTAEGESKVEDCMPAMDCYSTCFLELLGKNELSELLRIMDNMYQVATSEELEEMVKARYGDELFSSKDE